MSLLSGAFLLTIGNMVRAVRVFGEITNAFFLLAGGMKKAAAANGLLSASFLASPIFWVILLILALVAAFVILWIKCEAFREFWKGLWEDIKGAAESVGEFFSKLWDDISEFFSNWEEHWETAKNAVGDAWKAIKGFFSKMGKTIGGFFSGIGSEIGDFFSSVGSFISDDVWGPFTEAIGNAGEAVVNFFEGLPALAQRGLSSLVSLFTENIGKLPHALGYALGFMLGRMLRFGYDIGRVTREWTNQVHDTIVTWGTNLLISVGTFLTNLLTSMRAWGGGR